LNKQSPVSSDSSEPRLATADSLLVADLQVDFATQLSASVIGKEFPAASLFELWARTAYYFCPNNDHSSKAELSIQVVDEANMQSLNYDYRGKDKPTNVLSFPSDLPELVRQDLERAPLGDIVICHQVILEEAREQNKCVSSHYAHMVVHGVLHLCGYDHENDQEALEMESLEVRILHRLGVSNPYS
jgi:probable rRNA maturation factor